MRRLLPVLMAITGLGFLVFGAVGASAAAPTIPFTGVSEVTTTSATLEADVNPQEKASEYRFEYGLADCASNPCTSTPVPDGKLKKGGDPVRVTAHLEGLQPGTTYHFRVVAHNTEGEVKSPDRVFTTHAPPQIFDACPNDALRNKGAGKSLPDCRAYEQASPVFKNGGDVTNHVPLVGASVTGDAVAFLSDAGIPGGEGSQELPLYLASRGAGGWSTQGLLPHGSTGQRARVLGWLPDYSQVYDRATILGDSLMNTFLVRSSSDHALTTISPYLPEADYSFAGAAADGSAVLFETKFKLPGTSGLEGKSNVYVWDRESGEVQLASVMNDEIPPAKGAFAGSYDWLLGTNATTLSQGGAQRNYYTQDQQAVSEDGSVAYFTAASTGQLYMRLNPAEEPSPLDGEGKCLNPDLACTIQVNASQKTNGAGPGGTDSAGTRPAAFMGASADGSKAFFTSSEKLTNDANTGPEIPPPVPPKIGIAKPDGSEQNPSLVPNTPALGLAVNGSHLYWLDPERESVTRANLDGSSPEEDFVATPGATGIAVDDEYIYWANPGANTIGRATIDGKTADQSFLKVTREPTGIAVNDDYIFWTTHEVTNGGLGSGRAVSRADIDGSNIKETFIITCGCAAPDAIAASDIHVYFSWEYLGERYLEGRLTDGSSDPSYSTRLDSFGGIGRIPNIAVDGSHVYWTEPRAGTIGRSDLNLKDNITQKFMSGLTEPQGLAVDSSHIYWSSLPASEVNPGNDLYRYDADAEANELMDLASDPVGTNGADVQGLLGTSEDGSSAYFAANGDLDGTGPATPGNCSGPLLNGKGLCNLYLWHEGDVRFIAQLDGSGSDAKTDAANWAATPTGAFPVAEFQKTSRVTSDGNTLLFRSRRQLTAYDNEGVPQLYRYYVPDESILCVSCNPTGETPTARPTFTTISPTAIIPGRPASVPTRVLSDDGKRVFFETTEALVSTDVNGEGGCPVLGGYLNTFPLCLDVYEWEAEGKGSCERQGGCLYLLSTGTEEQASHFAGMSASGDDAFIYTRASLVPQDTDSQRDVYDVRVGGGLASQYPKPKTGCEAEGCKPAPASPPQSQSAGTAAFVGPPNPKPKHKKKVRHKRKHRSKRASHRRAHANRRAHR